MGLGSEKWSLVVVVLGALAFAPGCGNGNRVIGDPVGYSTFYVRNDGTQPIVVRFVVASSFSALGPGGDVVIAPASQAFILRAASLSWPPPNAVFSAIEIREQDGSGRLLYRQEPVLDSAWQRTQLGTGQPSTVGYTLVYPGAVARNPTD